jgi:ParB-like nuclease domain
VPDDHEFSVDAARAASARDELESWVARFLASPGSDNAPLAAQLTERRRWWLGPVSVPLHDLHRLAGPPDHPVLCPVDDDDWRDDVDELADRIDEDGWDPPPVIATYEDGRLLLEDGNHRVEGLRRAGEEDAWVVVAFDDPAERDRFAASASG